MAVYLITGCAGFIGSHLADVLVKSKHKVIGVDNFDSFYSKEKKNGNIQDLCANENFIFYEFDITEVEKWRIIQNEPPIDIVIHLAAKAGVRPSIDNPTDYIKNNIYGTQVLLNWMRISGIKNLVFASSSSIYGNNQKIPFEETDNVDFPISPYAYTKKACELMIHTFYHIYNINSLCLRFFTVYGPRQRPDLAICKFVEQIHNNQPITLFGDGSSARDYTYIDDIIDGIVKSIQLLENNKDQTMYEIINLGNNNPVLLNDLIQLLGELMQKEVKINREQMQEGDVIVTYANIDKALKLINYKPATKINIGIEKFLKWFYANERIINE